MVGVGVVRVKVGAPEGGCRAPARPTCRHRAPDREEAVLLGPTCEGATRADACTEPYAARLIILDADGTPVGEASSGADGLFEIVLPPGVYTIQPVPPEGDALFPVAFPVSVVVGEEEWTEVGIDYDTGIR